MSTAVPEMLSLGSSGSGVLLRRLDMSPRLRCLCLRLYWNSAYSLKEPQNLSLKIHITFYCSHNVPNSNHQHTAVRPENSLLHIADVGLQLHIFLDLYIEVFEINI